MLASALKPSQFAGSLNVALSIERDKWIAWRTMLSMTRSLWDLFLKDWSGIQKQCIFFYSLAISEVLWVYDQVKLACV